MKLCREWLNKALIHEKCWLLYLLVMTSLLMWYAPLTIWTLFSFGCIGLVITLVSCKSDYMRLGVYFILMNIVFNAIKYISPKINPNGLKDELLYKADIFLTGHNWSVVLEKFSTPFWTEILSFAYMIFMLQLFLRTMMYLFWDKSEVRQRYFGGLMTLYAFGYLGYIFMPAVGPYIYLADVFKDPLNAGVMRDLLNWSYPKGTNYSDVFPSLHCGVSLFILLADYAYHRRIFYVSLIPCILLWFSTVYLRYHYLVDCIAGFSLAIICFIVMKKMKVKKEVE